MAAQAPAWHHHTLMRASGAVTATVSYDHRPGLDRNAVVVVRRDGRIVMRRELRSLRYGNVTLTLRDVWGDREPEVIVRATLCGNRCGYWVYLAIPKTRHLFWRWFGHNGVSIQKNAIVSTDERFFCFFTACAGSAAPLQIFAVNRAGSRLADVTRVHRELLRADAAQLRSSFDFSSIGIRAPYCAEEYLLGRRAYCDRVLPARVQRQLAAWGYR